MEIQTVACIFVTACLLFVVLYMVVACASA